ncbi:hypothetical protein, partial [Paenibacillus residui]
ERNCIHGYFFMVRTPELGGLAAIALESGIAQIFPRKTCTFAFLYEIEEQNLGDSFIKRFSSGVPETFRLWLQLLK